MADLFAFPTSPKTRRTRRIYQIHTFDFRGLVVSSRLIAACDDTDARQQTSALDETRRHQLWCGARFVGQFDNPEMPPERPATRSVRPRLPQSSREG